MIDITAKYDAYRNIVVRDIAKSSIVWIVCALVFATALFFLVRWKKRLSQQEQKLNAHKQNRKNREEKEETNQAQITCTGCILVSCALLALAVGFNVISFSKAAFDLRNNAFVAVEDFEVIRHDDLTLYRTAIFDYSYQVLLPDGEAPLTLSPLNRYGISAGKYDNFVIVYAEHSRIVVDIFEKGQ